MSDATIIAQTSQWINNVVIGCNFCPFAAKSVFQKSIRYVVLQNATIEQSLEALMEAMGHLDRTESIETTLLIFPDQFADFEEYLDLVELAETLSEEQGYDGVYQIASFHPDYCFADADSDDPANYTNRSPYPMLHLLREESVSNAVDHFIDPEGIPERNMAFSRAKGLEYMQKLRASCFETDSNQ